VLEKLVVDYSNQLEALAQVALDHPKSLQQLREVVNNGHIHESLHQIVYRDDKKRIFNQHIKAQKSDSIYEMFFIFIFQCFYELLTKCHKLEKIKITPVFDEFVKLAQGNEYVATINAIDPDFIKYIRSEAGYIESEDSDTEGGHLFD
jgi:hypothetical protein